MKITRLKKYYFDALIFLVAFLYLFPWGYIEKDAYSALVSYDAMHEDEVSDTAIHNFVSDTNEAESLYSTLQAVGYQLDGVKNGFQTVPHVFLPKIPKDIKNLYRKTLQIYYFVEVKNIKKKRMKALYSPLEEQKSNKKVLKFIKNRSNISKFFNYYKT